MNSNYSFLFILLAGALLAATIVVKGQLLLKEESTGRPMIENEDFEGTTIETPLCSKYNTIEENNKRIVLQFYQEVLGDKNINAIDKYIDKDTYIQHNPYVADGREALKNAAKIWFKNDPPKEKIDFQHVGADGDFVWLHIKTIRDEKVTSIMDIFRLNNQSKIVEHWDVIQHLPNKSQNDHPLF